MMQSLFWPGTEWQLFGIRFEECHVRDPWLREMCMKGTDQLRSSLYYGLANKMIAGNGLFIL